MSLIENTRTRHVVNKYLILEALFAIQLNKLCVIQGSTEGLSKNTAILEHHYIKQVKATEELNGEFSIGYRHSNFRFKT